MLVSLYACISKYLFPTVVTIEYFIETIRKHLNVWNCVGFYELDVLLTVKTTGLVSLSVIKNL